MANLLRLIFVALLALLAVPAHADGGPFPATPGVWDTATCSQSAHPTHGYEGDSAWSVIWACRPVDAGRRQCGYEASNPAYSWANPYWKPMCSQGKGPGTCPAGASQSTGSSGEAVCTCTAGLRPSNGQCVALPACPEGQHEEGGACVPDRCKPTEIRVNGVCVPDPDLCPDGKKKVDGKCEEKCPVSGTLAGEYRVNNITPWVFCENKCLVSVSSFLHAIKDGKVMETVGIGYYTGGACTGPSEPQPPDNNNNNGGGSGGNGGGGNNNGGGGNTGGGGGGNNGGGGGNNNGGHNNNNPDKCPNGDCTGTGGTGGNGEGGTSPGADGTCASGSYMSSGRCYPKEPPKKPPNENGKCPPGTYKNGNECIVFQPPSDEEQGEADELCKKNPELPACTQGSFSGACMSGFSCEGDAVQCAIAREQHVRACKLFDEESFESKLYNENKGKTGNQTGDLPGNESISIAGRIDQSDALGGGGCIADVNVTVWKQSISLPFSAICPSLGYLGYVLLAVSFLLALRIVTRG